MKTGTIRRKGVATQGGKDNPRRESEGRQSPEALEWKLPSGKGFAEYALRARFFTPSLLNDYDHTQAGGNSRASESEFGGQQ